jgi:hypothetical protein
MRCTCVVHTRGRVTWRCMRICVCVCVCVCVCMHAHARVRIYALLTYPPLSHTHELTEHVTHPLDNKTCIMHGRTHACPSDPKIVNQSHMFPHTPSSVLQWSSDVTRVDGTLLNWIVAERHVSL